MHRTVRPCWVVVGVLAIGLSGCAGETKPRTSNKHLLGLKDATISIVGDDGFIKSRFSRKVPYREYEALTFPGGFLSYGKAHPGYSLTSSLLQHHEIIHEFREFKPAKHRRMSISPDDVRIGRNVYGTYAVAARENSRGACIRVLQYFGPTDIPSSPGNQRVRLGACWDPGSGGKRTLEAFVHDLMSRVRFDDGAINRAKAASRP